MPRSILPVLLAALVVAGCWLNGADAAGQTATVDLLGDYRASRYNFTDLVDPYDGVDGFVVLRLGLWADEARRVGLFSDAIPVVATVDEFFFQRYVQFAVGLQIYPVGVTDSSPGPTRQLLRPLRLFAQYSRRTYYDDPGNAGLVATDTSIGFDYYLDNLFSDSRMKAFVFTVGAFHSTNFSLDDYSGAVWSGNVKVGPQLRVSAGSRLVPYGFVDWTVAPGHSNRFFENFLRGGGGLRWYPAAEAGGAAGAVLRRLHVYGEALRNVAWLGDAPTSAVRRHDLRAGIAFATGGIYRDRR